MKSSKPLETNVWVGRKQPDHLFCLLKRYIKLSLQGNNFKPFWTWDRQTNCARLHAGRLPLAKAVGKNVWHSQQRDGASCATSVHQQRLSALCAPGINTPYTKSLGTDLAPMEIIVLSIQYWYAQCHNPSMSTVSNISAELLQWSYLLCPLMKWDFIPLLLLCVISLIPSINLVGTRYT